MSLAVTDHVFPFAVVIAAIILYSFFCRPVRPEGEVLSRLRDHSSQDSAHNSLLTSREVDLGHQEQHEAPHRSRSVLRSFAPLHLPILGRLRVRI
jgi:hypothetical protein